MGAKPSRPQLSITGSESRKQVTASPVGPNITEQIFTCCSYHSSPVLCPCSSPQLLPPRHLQMRRHTQKPFRVCLFTHFLSTWLTPFGPTPDPFVSSWVLECFLLPEPKTKASFLGACLIYSLVHSQGFSGQLCTINTYFLIHPMKSFHGVEWLGEAESTSLIIDRKA